MAITAKTVRSKIALGLCLATCGCASKLQTLTPSANFLTSETQGESLKTVLSLGAIEGTSVHADLEEDTEKLEFGSGKNFSQIFLMPQMGLVDRVDVFARFSSHSPFMYGVKWQVFGPPRTETSRGSESFSIYMSGGRHRYQSPSELNLETGGDFEANRTHTMVDYGAVYGTRLYSDILAYARYSRIIQDVHGKIEFEENQNLDGESFDLDGSHDAYGLGIVWYTERINLGLEAAHLSATWNEAPNTSSTSLMLSLSKNL